MWPLNDWTPSLLVDKGTTPTTTSNTNLRCPQPFFPHTPSTCHVHAIQPRLFFSPIVNLSNVINSHWTHPKYIEDAHLTGVTCTWQVQNTTICSSFCQSWSKNPPLGVKILSIYVLGSQHLYQFTYYGGLCYFNLTFFSLLFITTIDLLASYVAIATLVFGYQIRLG